jgi:hypothetical protein
MGSSLEDSIVPDFLSKSDRERVVIGRIVGYKCEKAIFDPEVAEGLI